MAATNYALGAGSSPAYTPQDLRKHHFARLHMSLPESSQRQYTTTWRQWCSFCMASNSWPAFYRQTEHQPAPFCSNRATFAGIIVLVVTLIRNSLPETSSYSPRISRPPNSRKLVTVEALELILAQLDPNKAQQRVIGGTALLVFFFLQRSADYLAVKGARRNTRFK
ncbi:LOW QUALITY PROTEIN: hypothetical protein PHMEG_0003376 [Phytophthora megakarya]|uniref:Uncharacterized protein n=1 Tax=Phytophthora megakarya TaxID=4795 RepID=A0A225WY96_9STRA|nr:LOW QUALITY PROTEIN: hypothetical protein PHMEG_0003376 [Phytophthora megakarya]